MDSKHVSAVAGASAAVLTLTWLFRRRAESKLTPWKGNFGALRKDDLPADGRELFSAWVHEAEKKDGFSARVMAVATCTPEEGPTVRSVIFHTMLEDGSIVFGTNSQSQKSRCLLQDPRCELLFRWGDRQIRIRGRAEMGNSAENEAAFGRLPRHCQLGLHCLSQGQNCNEEQHQESISAYAGMVSSYGLADDGKSVPRPSAYTAVIVRPKTFEFYQGGQPGYINDRFLFARQTSAGAFSLVTRLQA